MITIAVGGRTIVRDRIKQEIIDLLRNKRTQLPTLPVVVQNVIRISRDDSTSAADLAAFIAQDQALANKVLRLANSPYYGMGGKVDSIQRAITIIGFDEVVSLAIGIGVFPALKKGGALSLLDVESLWLHAIGACFAGKLVCSYFTGVDCVGRHNEKSVFLTCLLHDIGKIVFALYFEDEYRQVLERANEEGRALHEVEVEMLGLDHGTFAALLMRHWNFPETIVTPVRYHHFSRRCPLHYQADAAVIWLANYLVRAAQIGSSANPAGYPVREATTLFVIDRDGLEDLTASLIVQRQEIENFLSIIQ